uniref:WD repeat-containing protein 82-like n=1 Tax=Piliocolobus tephrosceles TaxID=591936 RepID=A0A8C9I3B3_9PRIM
METIAYKKIKLNDDIIKKFEILRVFKYRQAITKNMVWNDTGDTLLTSSANDSITIYNLLKKNSIKTLQSKNCGVDVVRFLNNNDDVVVCSTNSNNTEYKQFLRFWNIKENKYIKSLPQMGNICKKNGISINKNKKLILVNSDDGHVKLYYFNCDYPLIVYISDFKRPVSAFDHEGNVFIASYGKKKIHFYDLLMYDRGEYNVVSLQNYMDSEEFITNFSFTPNNKYIIVSTNKNNHFSIYSNSGQYKCSYKYPQPLNYTDTGTTQNKSNSYIYKEGKNKNFEKEMFDRNRHHKDDRQYQDDNFTNHNKSNKILQNKTSPIFIPTITPDGQYVMCGWEDCGVHIWNENGNHVTTLYDHAGPPDNVTFNPKCSILASSCLNVALWQPVI